MPTASNHMMIYNAVFSKSSRGAALGPYWDIERLNAACIQDLLKTGRWLVRGLSA